MISGFVDGLIGEHVQGWIANLEQPESLEPLQVICDDAQPVSFLPLIYRLDVCRHLGIDGRFGFAIPIGMFGNGVRHLTITTRDGHPLEGGLAVRVGEARASRSKRQHRSTRVYLHIQKTSGTSLRADIAARLTDAQVLYVYPTIEQGIPDFMLNQIPRQQLGSFELIFGHMAFGVHHLLDDSVQYATMLRDPVARLRSQIWHMIRREEAGLLPCPMETLANTDRSDELDNLMVRIIAGAGVDDVPYGCIDDSAVAQALANIRERFCYVALSESSTAGYEGLLSALRVRPRDRSRLNQAGATSVVQTMSSLRVDWPGLLHRNRFDIRLYQAIVEADLFDRPLL